ASQPQPRTPPEVIQRPDMSKVNGQQASQRCHRKVDQHGVQGMPGDCGAAVNGISVIGHPALQEQKGKRTTQTIERVGSLLKWTTLALSVPLLAACGGPLSSLNPASPMARQVANVWWGMFAFATLVLIVVSVLWVYALARKPRETSDEQAI